jgi:hypothetical protein
MQEQQREPRQHDAGDDRSEQQEIGLEGEVLDAVPRRERDGGVLLDQPLHLLMDIDDLIRQIRSA